jgi:hypothetical protein
VGLTGNFDSSQELGEMRIIGATGQSARLRSLQLDCESQC